MLSLGVKETKKEEARITFEQLAAKISDSIDEQNVDQLSAIARNNPVDGSDLQTKEDLQIYLVNAKKQTIIAMADFLKINYIALELTSNSNKDNNLEKAT